MAVRNCAELGENLQKIITRLMANQTLVKLLYYEDKDPLSQPDLTDAEKRELIYEKYIKIIPRITQQDNARSIVAMRVVGGIRNSSNGEFRDVQINFEVFVPMTQWFIKGSNLRPFAILGEIQKSLDQKTINGLGKMVGGDFEVMLLGEEMSCYETSYTIIAYD